MLVPESRFLSLGQLFVIRFDQGRMDPIVWSRKQRSSRGILQSSGVLGTGLRLAHVPARSMLYTSVHALRINGISHVWLSLIAGRF